MTKTQRRKNHSKVMKEVWRRKRMAMAQENGDGKFILLEISPDRSVTSTEISRKAAEVARIV